MQAFSTDSLEQLQREIWNRLVRGAEKPKDAFHFPCVATLGAEGPEARTVVLRQVIPVTRVLAFHTDRRSPKLHELATDPRVAWHFYDRAGHVQVRVRARATVLTEGEQADARFAWLPLRCRRTYLVSEAPGTPVEAPTSALPRALVDRDPTEAEAAVGRPHFALIETEAVAIDWLWLRPNDHVRAQFTWEDGAWNGVWCVP